ncbi:MAG TPA: thymidine phosphorylase [Gemmataceae bacterium]
MRAVDVIRKKRDGLALSREELEAFARGATDAGAWPDYQLAALLMAIFLRGLSREETAHLTRAMAHSGEVLDWSGVPGPKVDKHSSGGVGDKTSLAVVPLAAACGVVVPKMSGRGLGHTGGTVDKLEAIPGFRTALSTEEFKAALKAVGAAMVGQTERVAPADKKIYALRDVTATVEHVPLITASILSKKLAENLDGLVLDVKCGRGAFMKTPADARRLAEELIAVAKLNGLPTSVFVTAMDQPLGRAIGHSLEVAEAVEILKGGGPADLRELALVLAARMVRLAGLAGSDDKAAAQVRDALAGGRALEKFRQIVERQGGDVRVIDDPARLPAAPNREPVRADRAGFVTGLDAEALGHAAVRLGGGRDRKENPIDHGVGIVLCAKVGDEVRPGEPLLEVHWRDAARLESARPLLAAAVTVGDARPVPGPVVLEQITG